MAVDAQRAIFRAMGVDRASDAGAALARAVGPLTNYDHVARVNMRRCFPEAEPPEIDRLMEGMWDNFGRCIGESANLDAFTGDGFNARLTLAGAEKLTALRDAGKPVIILGMHFGNLEIPGVVIARLGLDCSIVYRHVNNPLVNQRVLGARLGYGLKSLSRKGAEGSRDVIAALSAGAGVGLLCDQKMNDGIAAPFFGYDSMTAPGAARLAMRFGAPLIPLTARRLDGARFRVTAGDPVPVSTNPDRAEAIRETTANINRMAEEVIREAPEQWFWVHRRWDKAIYRKDARSSSSISAGST